MSGGLRILCALAFGFLGCSAAREKVSPAADVAMPLPLDAAAPERPRPAPIAALTGAAPRSTVAPPAAPAAPLRLADGPYAHFFASLRELEQRRRADHVRVVWLGDSHGAADFWSGALRSALQKRFGDGGIGFVHLGYAGYRHDRVKVVTEGKWRVRPRKPASVIPTDDGGFGLGGMLFGAESGAVRAELTVTDAPPSKRLLWDVCYRLATPTDGLSLSLANGPSTALKPAAGEPLGDLRHFLLASAGDATLTVVPSGSPELCGAVIEADPSASPGVVVDTLGINGARLATPLGWDEARWSAELARRAPVLAIVEYGTNEAGDLNVDPSLYGKHLSELLTRVRRVNEDVDCLVLSPTDRKDTPDRTPLVRDALRDAARAEGCGFWDTYQAMGGRGSIEAWRGDRPPRASRDGVHLTARGYRDLGSRLADDVLQRYRR